LRSAPPSAKLEERPVGLKAKQLQKPTDIPYRQFNMLNAASEQAAPTVGMEKGAGGSFLEADRPLLKARRAAPQAKPKAQRSSSPGGALLC